MKAAYAAMEFCKDKNAEKAEFNAPKPLGKGIWEDVSIYVPYRKP